MNWDRTPLQVIVSSRLAPKNRVRHRSSMYFPANSLPRSRGLAGCGSSLPSVHGQNLRGGQDGLWRNRDDLLVGGELQQVHRFLEIVKQGVRMPYLTAVAFRRP